MRTLGYRVARLAPLLVIAAGAVTVYLVLGSGASYTLKLEMDNANGLRQGSQVLLGGVPVGTVSSLNLGPRSLVVASLNLNPKQITIGRGASASINAANLLGEEYVSLEPGNRSRPLPSGTVLAPGSVTAPTDLDQIVDVFKGTTRQRLAVLINEMGIAVAGQRSNVTSLLRELPVSVSSATELLGQLIDDNDTLSDLVANSNQFIARIDRNGNGLRQVLAAASGAATTAANQASALRLSVIDAPPALQTAQRFLTSVTHTARTLAPAAMVVTRSAGPLTVFLSDVRPLSRAAVPTLNQAARVAPELTSLAAKGTPIVRQARPTVTALTKVATLSTSLTHWLGLSVVDALAALQGWTSGLQYRDGLGHVFHAELGISPGLITNLASSAGANAGRAAKVKRASAVPGRTSAGSAGTHPSVSGAVPPANSPATTGSGQRTSGLLHGLGSVLGGVAGALGGQPGRGAAGGTTTTPSGSGATGVGGGTSDLQHLLNYLLGR